MERIKNFEQMVEHLSRMERKRCVAVVCPNDDSTQQALKAAIDKDLLTAWIVGATDAAKRLFAPYGDKVKAIDAADADDAARKGVELVREGKADVLVKGLLNTDNLLHAVLNKEGGLLPKGAVLTHMACAELPAEGRMLLFSDAAVIPCPNDIQREKQLEYAVKMANRLGIDRPKVALVNCSEKVSEKFFPHTLHYREMAEKARRGDYGNVTVDGPLDLKTSLNAEALHKKGIESPVGGQADVLIFPGIQSANVFYKAMTFLVGAKTAGVLCGTTAPVVLPSRGDNTTAKFLSLAMACMME
mgnify:CR=1 FL=1